MPNSSESTRLSKETKRRRQEMQIDVWQIADAIGGPNARKVTGRFMDVIAERFDIERLRNTPVWQWIHNSVYQDIRAIFSSRSGREEQDGRILDVMRREPLFGQDLFIAVTELRHGGYYVPSTGETTGVLDMLPNPQWLLEAADKLEEDASMEYGAKMADAERLRVIHRLVIDNSADIDDMMSMLRKEEPA